MCVTMSAEGARERPRLNLKPRNEAAAAQAAQERAKASKSVSFDPGVFALLLPGRAYASVTSDRDLDHGSLLNQNEEVAALGYALR